CRSRPQPSTLLTTRGERSRLQRGRADRAALAGDRARRAGLIFGKRWNFADSAGTPTSGRADHQLQELGEDAGRGAPDRLAVELEEVHRSVVLAWEVPALLAVHLVGDQLGEADVEDAGHLGGVGPEARTPRQRPDEGRDPRSA